jgi:hypothetical protein
MADLLLTTAAFAGCVVGSITLHQRIWKQASIKARAVKYKAKAMAIGNSPSDSNPQTRSYPRFCLRCDELLSIQGELCNDCLDKVFPMKECYPGTPARRK